MIWLFKDVNHTCVFVYETLLLLLMLRSRRYIYDDDIIIIVVVVHSRQGSKTFGRARRVSR